MFREQEVSVSLCGRACIKVTKVCYVYLKHESLRCAMFILEAACSSTCASVTLGKQSCAWGDVKRKMSVSRMDRPVVTGTGLACHNSGWGSNDREIGVVRTRGGSKEGVENRRDCARYVSCI